MANLTRPSALFDFDPLDITKKFQQSYTKLIQKLHLQPQILAQGMDGKTERWTTRDRKLFRLMQNWEILFMVRQKYMG